MGALDVGSEAIDRSNIFNGGYTIIALDNPATADMLVNVLEVWFNTRLLVGLKIGSFYNTSGLSYKCRDSESLESPIIEGARRTIIQNIAHAALSIDFRAGDFIGMVALEGSSFIEKSALGYAGILYVLNDYCNAGDETTYAFMPDGTISVKGLVVPLSPGGATILGLLKPDYT